MDIVKCAKALQNYKNALKEVEDALIDESIPFRVAIGPYKIRVEKNEARQRLLELTRDGVTDAINECQAELEQAVKNM